MTPPLGPIGDMGVANLTEQVGGTITWETASDWDAAVSQDPNVIHEAIGSITDDTEVRLGYSASDFGGNSAKTTTLPSDDSGSPLTNASGAVDFSEAGNPTYGNTGVFGIDHVNVDGTNDIFEADSTTFSQGAGQFTLLVWVNHDNLGSNRRLISHQGQITSNDVVLTLRMNGNNVELLARDSANGILVQATGSTTLVTGTWYCIAARVDAANNAGYVYLDGSQEASGSGTLSTSASAWDADSDPFTYGAMDDTSDPPAKEEASGTIGWGQIWTRDVGSTAVADLSSLTGQLETGTKSLSGQSQPNLTGLDYVLNGKNLEIEAIGSPGTASEEVVTSGNLDGTQTSATLSWTDSHTDFRIRPILKTTKPPTNTPILRAASLEA